ncbi:MAG: hypothetical protein ACI9FR_002014 [Cryomorphaceae bacterium]
MLIKEHAGAPNSKALKISRPLRIQAMIAVFFLSAWFGQSAWAAAPDAVRIDFWNDSEPQSTIKVNHSVWQSVLDKYLDDKHPSGINRFDYLAVSQVDRALLDDYLNYLQQMEPRQLSIAEQKPFWINLYNAKTVEVVLRRLQSDSITSIRQIRSGIFTPGPWKNKLLTLSRQEISLDDIEHGILRPNFNDRRIHYALNCAALGCPSLLKTAFTSENTEQLLAFAERSFLSHPRAARIQDSELVLSSLFDWYASDFAYNPNELLAYIKKFTSAETSKIFSQQPETRFEYDWALNKP